MATPSSSSPWANVIHRRLQMGSPQHFCQGSLQGMITAAEWILRRANDSTRIVPGRPLVAFDCRIERI
jgi:hypothetical protein